MKAACTVSAAALMLGVSHAATVGLHFQVNYCYDARYTGFPVTMTAFGIDTNSWENLAQMNTGYGCGGGTPPYVLSTMISTTTSTGGLNPLPNGSLTVTWSADTANFSGFAGYGGGLPGYQQYAGPPGYDYGGPPPPSRNPAQPFPTGEWEVYSAFLRDGVNFGPYGTQPGYSVDIVGLKSVFTNSPFVIELVAASDSMQNLTNAFIIDATASVTNSSVTYPATPFPSVNYDSTGGWFRGHGGGLSTMSNPLNTDHVQIVGNRAANGTSGGPNGFDNASTISGFIVTDKPVVTMSPRSLLASAHDTVTLNPYAIGVPPLSYQWRKGGVPIPGATNADYVITGVSSADGGNYDLVVTNLYGSATSSVAIVTADQIALTSGNNFVVDSNPAGVEHDGYDLGATWLASSTDGASTTRTGVMSFAAASSNQIVVPAATNFNTSTGTIMFWMRSAGVANPANGEATLFDRLTSNNGLVIEQNPDGTLSVTNAAVFAPISVSVSDNNWHHIAVVYDQSFSGYADIYVDSGLQISAGNFAAWTWQPGQEIELGFSHNAAAYQPFNGVMDDVRVYNRVLTSTEIASVFSSDALVDTNALVLRLNFDGSPGAGLLMNWQSPDGVLQSADSVIGPYTDLPGVLSPYATAAQKSMKFYRYRHTSASLISNPFLM